MVTFIIRTPLLLLQVQYQAMYDNLPDLSSEELAKLKWWSDIEPSRLKSR